MIKRYVIGIIVELISDNKGIIFSFDISFDIF